MYFSKFKIFAILISCILGILIALPNFYDNINLPFHKKVNLGLELQGGSYLQLQVDLEQAYKDELQLLSIDFKRVLKKNKIKFTDFKFDQDAIKLTLENADDAKKVVDLASNFHLLTDIEDKEARFHFDKAYTSQKDATKIEQCLEIIKLRVNPTGITEPEIYRQGKDRIVVQLPGTEDPDEAKKLLGQTGSLSFRMVKNTVPKGHKETSPLYDVLPDANDKNIFYLVEKEILLSGDVLDKVKVQPHQGMQGVVLEFNTVGAKKFGDITLENQGKQLAIVIDNVVVSAPKITQYIPLGIASISSPVMTIKEASRLKTILSSGSLPAPLKIIEERSVGPSLGNDAIGDGQKAVLISFGLVAIFMIMSYSLFGFFAVVSLFFNLVFIFAALSILGATLTLPGIAGLALTIGMAVDANVLIYERIKEELRGGLKVLRAIAMGFEHAMRTIVDSNLTTLIGAAILYEFGSGSIRGFAVTLTIGILASMFTALTLTYFQIYLWIRNKRTETLPM